MAAVATGVPPLGAADAAGADRKVRQALVAGLVGAGAALELLRFADAMDLPDPEELLADPSSLDPSSRIDLLLASLAGVTAAVAGRPTLDRWHAAWAVLGVACDAGRADVAALSAVGLIDLREDGWPAPPEAVAFAPTLRAAELI